MLALQRIRRYTPQFSLRTLFVATAIVAIWLGWNVHQVRERNQLSQEWSKPGNPVIAYPPTASTPPIGKVPYAWQILGASSELSVIHCIGAAYSDEEIARIKTLFPEAEVIQEGYGS